MAGMTDVFRLPSLPHASAGPTETSWLAALRGYLAATTVLNLAWETAQLPLYTIWSEGTAGSKAFAVLHCTAGDILIALSVLVGALIVAGDSAWPGRRAGQVTALTLLGGLAYTVFSEWLNVVVRGSWAYSDLMPVLPPFGTGLAPLLQWLVVPAIALRTAHRAGSAWQHAWKVEQDGRAIDDPTIEPRRTVECSRARATGEEP